MLSADAKDPVFSDQGHAAFAAEDHVVVEGREVLRIHHRDDDAGEASVGIAHRTRQEERLVAAHQPRHLGLADIQLVLVGADMDQIVLAVARVDFHPHRSGRGAHDVALGIDMAEPHGQSARVGNLLRPLVQVEIGGVGLIQAAQEAERLVGLLDRPDDMVLEGAGEVPGVAHRVLIGVVPLGLQRKGHAGPDEPNHGEAEQGGRLKVGPGPVRQLGADRLHACSPRSKFPVVVPYLDYFSVAGTRFFAERGAT